MQQWLPGLVLGLFCGRLLNEWWQPASIWLAAVAALACAALALILLRQRPFHTTWPLLILSVYVLFPEYDPQVAGLVLGVTAVAWILNQFSRTSWPPQCEMWGIALGGAFFLLYALTIAPDVLPADSGEFQLVAAQLGVAHPPGFPLYTLLAHAATRLPWNTSPALKVNLFSAFTSSLTLVVVFAAVYRLTRRPMAAATAVIALGSATTFWAQATTANIRSLTALFAALMLYTLLRFWEHGSEPNHHQRDRWLVLFALLLGWGVTHHVSLLFMGAVLGLFALLVDPHILRTPHRWTRPLLATLSGLFPLLYLPLRARSGAHGATPGLATWNGFLDHVLARGFSGDFFYFIEPAILWQRLLVMGNVMTFQFTPWLLAGMGVGLLWLLWNQRLIALLLGGSFFVHTFLTATYRAPQTVEYMLPAYIPAVMTLGVAVGTFLKQAGIQETRVEKNAPFPNRVIFLHRLFITLGSLLFVLSVAQTTDHAPSFAWLHVDVDTRDYTQPLLAQAPTDTTILADWHWATPLWYLQKVEGQRPDVDIRFVFPEAEPYSETWARRISAELAAGRNVIATHFDDTAYRNLPPALPLHEAFLYRQEPLLAVPADFIPLDVTLGGALRLLGYRISQQVIEIGAETAVTLAWEPVANLPTPLSLFVHLVSAEGGLIGQDDRPAHPQTAGITLTQFWLTPRPGAQPGTHTISVGAYTSDPLLDEADNSRTAVASLTLQAMQRPPFTTQPLYRPLADGTRILVGYDWDTTLPGQKRLYLHWQTPAGFVTEIRDNVPPQELALPPYVGAWGLPQPAWDLAAGWENGRYVPLGQGVVWLDGALSRQDSPVRLPQTFGSSRPMTRDLVVSVRLIGYQPDGFLWAWTEQDDGVPALGAIPTLKWIENSQIVSPHTLSTPEAATPGQHVGATLRLYDAFTQRPLPILDERITNQFPWIPLGEIIWQQN